MALETELGTGKASWEVALGKEREEKEGERRRLEEEIRTSQAEVVRLKGEKEEEIMRLEKEIVRLKGELTKEEGEREAWEKERGERGGAEAALQAEVSSLSARLEESLAQTTALSAARDQDLKALEEARAQSASLSAAAAAASAVVRDEGVQDEVQNLRRELESAKQEAQNLRNELERANRERQAEGGEGKMGAESERDYEAGEATTLRKLLAGAEGERDMMKLEVEALSERVRELEEAQRGQGRGGEEEDSEGKVEGGEGGKGSSSNLETPPHTDHSTYRSPQKADDGTATSLRAGRAENSDMNAAMREQLEAMRAERDAIQVMRPRQFTASIDPRVDPDFLNLIEAGSFT